MYFSVDIVFIIPPSDFYSMNLVGPMNECPIRPKFWQILSVVHELFLTK